MEIRLCPSRLSVLPPAHLSSGWHSLSIAVYDDERSRTIRGHDCRGRAGCFAQIRALWRTTKRRSLAALLRAAPRIGGLAQPEAGIVLRRRGSGFLKATV